jgi:hypothetical protein
VHARGDPKKITLQGKILKEFFAGGKTKFAYFTGGKDLFTPLQKICLFVALYLRGLTKSPSI